HDSGANVLHFNNGFSLRGGKRFGSAKKHPSSCNCASSLNFFVLKSDVYGMVYHVVKAHDSGENVWRFNNGLSLLGGKRFGSAKKHPSSCNCASSINSFMVKKIKGFDGLLRGEGA